MSAPEISGLHRRTYAPAPVRRDHTETPFHSRRFGDGWRSVVTEQVAGYRLMQWPTAEQTHHLPYYLVDSSPLWTAMEGDAGLDGSVWRGSVTYARTLYGEYGGLPGAPAPVLAEAVDRGRDLAAEWDSTALVVTNLPPHEADRWRHARRPDAEVTLYWAHRTQLGQDVDDFIASGGPARKARRELRRQWRRGSEAGLRLRILRGPELLPYADQITEQARSTSGRHGPVLYGQEMIRAVSTVPGALALVADHVDGMAGAFIALRHRDTLYLWTAALDESRRADLHTYAWLMHQSVIYACHSGAATLDCGRGNYRYKRSIGLDTTPLTSLVYLTPHADRGVLGRLTAMHRGLQAHAHRAWQSEPLGPAPTAPAPGISLQEAR